MMQRNQWIPAAPLLCDPVPRSVPGRCKKRQAQRSTLGAQFTQRHLAPSNTANSRSKKKPKTSPAYRTIPGTPGWGGTGFYLAGGAMVISSSLGKKRVHQLQPRGLHGAGRVGPRLREAEPGPAAPPADGSQPSSSLAPPALSAWL
ncbi:hypothetical protein NDU88_003442 [Pleurodeles waltl]|uniref:Uncharacterized protein n=1 Tax=Pleurodeles waltl TaxID=8319 RepID=A0AAV7W671_PLEWA|nr:hypothetical protein NDU88_003442 [Pleurodeles waltl]